MSIATAIEASVVLGVDGSHHLLNQFARIRVGVMGSAEELLTAVYQYEVRAGWSLQPNFQYIFHLGGGATNTLGTFAARPQRCRRCWYANCPKILNVLNPMFTLIHSTLD